VGSIEQQKLQASSKGYNKGYLRDQLSYEASINQLLFGANLEYVATHHYGREEDGIVQREVIGIASGPWNDGDEILAILQDHLQAS
jgi:phage gpG-like protein